jgi:hypothetical protein
MAFGRLPDVRQLLLVFSVLTRCLVSPAQVPATLNVDSLNGVCMADRKAGADAGAKIAACYSGLPAGGGIIDARGLTGAQTISTDITASWAKNVHLILADGATYTLTTGLTIPGALSPDKSIKVSGGGWRGTILQAGTNSITLVDLQVFAQLDNVSLYGNGHTSVRGLRMRTNSSARYLNIEDCSTGIYLEGSNSGAYGVYYADVDHVRIKDCTFGIYLYTADGSVNSVNANHFRHFQITGSTSFAIVLTGADGNTFIQGDIEQNTGEGVSITDGSANVVDAWFEANTAGNLDIAATPVVQNNVFRGSGLQSDAVTVNTTGAIASGTATLAVAAADGIVKGKRLTIAGAGAAGADLVSRVTNVSGTTITIANRASRTVGPAALVYGPTFYANASNSISGESHTHVWNPQFKNPFIEGILRHQLVPGTTYALTDFQAGVTTAYWRDSSGNVRDTMTVSNGNRVLGGTLAWGGGAALPSSASTGTGEIVRKTSPALTTPSVTSLNTAANCSSAASPAACAAAPAGLVFLPAGGTTLQVNTRAVTANSRILITEDSSLSGFCNTTAGRTYAVTARLAGTSFTITANAAPVVNPACLNYWIVN